MEATTIDEKTLERIKELPRIDFFAFKELVASKQVKSWVKFKRPRTIFYDEETKLFIYLNPYYKKLNSCGRFYEEGEVENG